MTRAEEEAKLKREIEQDFIYAEAWKNIEKYRYENRGCLDKVSDIFSLIALGLFIFNIVISL
jgi:hypothetical protein